MIIRDKEAAKDISQEVFIKVYKSLKISMKSQIFDMAV